jgi:hypothetical protein
MHQQIVHQTVNTRLARRTALQVRGIALMFALAICTAGAPAQAAFCGEPASPPDGPSRSWRFSRQIESQPAFACERRLRYVEEIALRREGAYGM